MFLYRKRITAQSWINKKLSKRRIVNCFFIVYYNNVDKKVTTFCTLCPLI